MVLKYTASVIVTVVLLFTTVLTRQAPSTDQTAEQPAIPPTSAVSPEPQTPRTFQWGTYTGWLVSDIIDFEARVGKPINLLATFVHWGNESEFPTELANFAKTNNKTLVIFWEAMDYNVDGPNDTRFSYDAILRGDWDTYLTSFAESAQTHAAPVILIPFEEVNGNWYAWSGTQNGNSPSKHIEAFRYVRKFFSTATNVKFAWDVNAISEPDTADNSILSYYPGDQYVDYIGINGFNFGDPWMSFGEIFSGALNQLSNKGKPIYIFSMASADGSQKADWIKDFGREVNNRFAIKGWIWFNENKEKDWRVWSDEASLQAFKSILP